MYVEFAQGLNLELTFMTCLVVAETVVGATTGCLPAPKGYFRACREVCDKYGALFMLDEVMSGMGRMSSSPSC